MLFFCSFRVSLADVDILYSDSLSRKVAFNCLIFKPEISNRMVFVNGKHLRFHVVKCAIFWKAEVNI